MLQVRVAAAQARVHLCDSTLESILSAANLTPSPLNATNAQENDDVVMHEDAVLPEEEVSKSKLPGSVLSSMKTEQGSFCYLAQAAALSVAAQRLTSLHAQQAEHIAAGRKRTAAAADLDVGDGDEPPPAAVAALSPLLSMHAVPVLRHEAFKTLNASTGQEPSLLCLAAIAMSDVTASGLATRAPIPPLPLDMHTRMLQTV